jgi:predicted MPP superfamily phosphohydrolase
MFYLKNVAIHVQVFGDLHGSNFWQAKIDMSADKIIFLGDYVDSRASLSDIQIIANLDELLSLKKYFPDKVVLLWGNHDVRYLRLKMCTDDIHGYNWMLHKAFSKYEGLFQSAYQINNWLFTHAGLTRPFWRFVLEGSGTDYASVINRVFSVNPSLFNMASYTRGGNDYFGSTLWADRRDFKDTNNWLENLNQIVGHSAVPNITININKTSQMVWIDTWEISRGENSAIYEIDIPQEP